MSKLCFEVHDIPELKSEKEIQITIDGVPVTATAYRTSRSHNVQLHEPFAVYGRGQNPPLFGIGVYRESLKGLTDADLYQQSVDLVKRIYFSYKSILERIAAVKKAFAAMEPELNEACQAEEDFHAQMSIASQKARAKFKKGELTQTEYQALLKDLRNRKQELWAKTVDLKRGFIMQHFPNCHDFLDAQLWALIKTK